MTLAELKKASKFLSGVDKVDEALSEWVEIGISESDALMINHCLDAARPQILQALKIINARLEAIEPKKENKL